MRNVFRGMISTERLKTLTDRVRIISNPIEFFKKIEKESVLFMGIDVGGMSISSFIVVNPDKDITIQYSGKTSIPDLYDDIIYLIELIKPESIYVNINRDGGFSSPLIQQLKEYSNDHGNVYIYYENKNKMIEKKIRGCQNYEKKQVEIREYGTYFYKNKEYLAKLLKDIIENGNQSLSEELLNDFYRISYDTDPYSSSLLIAYLLALYMIEKK